MLDSLRKFGSTWGGKALVPFLLVGLAGFGITNVITSIGSNTLAKVGTKEITPRDFQRAYRDQLNALAQQTGTVPTAEQAVAFGIPSIVLGQLAGNAALDVQADALGLGVSDQTLGRMLRDDPRFASTLGTFDRQSFTLALQRQGLTESEYFEEQRNTARRDQIAQAIFASAPVPAVASALLNRFTGDRRTVDYFVLTPLSVPTPATPSDTELSAYLNDHQSNFRTVETRSAKVIVLTPELLAGAIVIGEEDIAAEYERTKAGLVTLETRTIEQVNLPQSAVSTFEAGKLAGTNLTSLLADAGLVTTALGTLARSEITDTTLADTAFSLAQGEFAIIEGALGKRVILVSAINAGGQQTLDEARDQIAEKLRLSSARNEFVVVLDQIEELRAAFEPIGNIARRFGLDLEQVTLDRSGTALNGLANLVDGDQTRIAAAVFAAGIDRLAPSLALSANRNVWFDLTAIEPARDQLLGEVREAVAAELAAQSTDAALAEMAAALAREVDAGGDMTEISAPLGLFAEVSLPFGRNGDNQTITGLVAAAAFGGGPGHSGFARNANGDYVVFKVTDIAPAGDDLAEQAKLFVENDMRNGLYSEFVEALRTDAGMQINQSALAQLIGLAPGPDTQGHN